MTHTSYIHIEATHTYHHISYTAYQYTSIVPANNSAHHHAPHTQRLYTIPDRSSLSDSVYVNPAGCRMGSKALVHLTTRGLVQEINRNNRIPEFLFTRMFDDYSFTLMLGKKKKKKAKAQ